MTTLWHETDVSLANPLDIAEQLMTDRDMAYDRPEHSAIVADMSGSWCNYQLELSWHQEFGALSFTCAIDSRIPPRSHALLYPLLAKINPRLWLGHFELAEDGAILFRYSMQLKGVSGISIQQLEDLLDIAVSECERFYPAFQSLLWGGKTADEALELALMDTVGEA